MLTEIVLGNLSIYGSLHPSTPPPSLIWRLRDVCLSYTERLYPQLFRDKDFCIRLYDTNPAHWLVGRVFANGPEDLGSIPGRIIPKTLKMVLDTTLLNTQQYTSPRCSSYWKGNFWLPLNTVANFTFFIWYQIFLSNTKKKNSNRSIWTFEKDINSDIQA